MLIWPLSKNNYISGGPNDPAGGYANFSKDGAPKVCSSINNHVQV
jgi:hypothetical protein